MAELTDVVADAAEEVAGGAITVANVSRSMSGRDFGMGFISGGISSGLVVFLWARRHFETKFDKIAQEEISEIRDLYRRKAAVVAEKPSPEKIVVEQGYVPKSEPRHEGLVNTPPPMPQKPKTKAEEIIQKNNALTEPHEWNQEAEIAMRTPDRPYIIHRYEYAETSDYTGVTLTYYEGDDILVDEDNKPVENKERLVGGDNLAKFGHGSGDPHVVYIRNEALQVDIEVIRNEKSYAEVMHGFRDSNRSTYGGPQ